MGWFSRDATAGLPRNARCGGCEEPIAERKFRGSNQWTRGPRMANPSEYPLGGNNPDGSSNLGGEVCKTNDAKHKPDPESIW